MKFFSKIIFCKILILSFLFQFSVHASISTVQSKYLVDSKITQIHELAKPSKSCACDTSVDDRFEEPSQFNFGEFNGQCIDMCHYRRSSFLNLSASKLKHTNDKTVLLLSNLLHDRKFRKAEVPLNQVQNASVGFEEFFPGVFHVFLIFQFSKDHPVKLYPQDGNTEKSHEIYDLVLSPQGVPPREGNYNFLDASLGRYLINVRVLSRSEMYNWSVKKHNFKVNTYELLIKHSEVVEVLRQGLLAGEKDSFRIKYGLFSNNCATSTFDFIDAVVKPEVTKSKFYYSLIYPLERALPLAGPLGTLNVLFMRKLVEANPKPF